MQDAAARQRRLVLMGRLHDAQDDHNATVLATRGGVGATALDGDILRWRALGASIVELARLVRCQCEASTFCDARPRLEPLAVRLIEAIDDLIDRPVWIVIDAQVRLLAASTGG
jgi:hypothetical protein